MPLPSDNAQGANSFRLETIFHVFFIYFFPLPFSNLGEYFLHLTLANAMLFYSFFSLTVPYLFASHSPLT